MKITMIIVTHSFISLRSLANFKAEYEYTDCSHRITSVQKFQVNGFSSWTEDFYGYSLNVHHR